MHPLVRYYSFKIYHWNYKYPRAWCQKTWHHLVGRHHRRWIQKCCDGDHYLKFKVKYSSLLNIHSKVTKLYKILLLTIIICCHFYIAIQSKAKTNSGNKFISQHWVLNQNFARTDFKNFKFHKWTQKQKSELAGWDLKTRNG